MRSTCMYCQRAHGGATRERGYALTVLSHPDLTRVGEIAALDDAPAPGAREPVFRPPRGEGNRWLFDRPELCAAVRIRPASGGVHVAAAGEGVRLDGERLGDRVVSCDEVARGVTVEWGEVVLLLHLADPSLPLGAPMGMVGEGDAIRRVRAALVQAADDTGPLLLLGESGTGKEVGARGVVASGPRASQPFVAVNLAAVPPSIAASELFGHVAGAFTGAQRRHLGYFDRADGGTLFLDEIGAAPLEVQAMLLRVLESGEIHPLGGHVAHRVDVRVIAATDEDLPRAIAEGRFRSALYHRLSAFTVAIPPLRQRREDIGRLVVHFLREEERRARPTCASPEPLPVEVVAGLARLPWPGNVRQLASVVHQLALARRHGVPLSIPPPCRAAQELARGCPGEGAEVLPYRRPRAPSQLDEEALLRTLRDSGWQISGAARRLGISRTTLYARIQASARLRTAKAIPEDELRRAWQACEGDVATMSDRFGCSARALRLRLHAIGLAAAFPGRRSA